MFSVFMHTKNKIHHFRSHISDFTLPPLLRSTILVDSTGPPPIHRPPFLISDPPILISDPPIHRSGVRRPARRSPTPSDLSSTSSKSGKMENVTDPVVPISASQSASQSANASTNSSVNPPTQPVHEKKVEEPKKEKRKEKRDATEKSAVWDHFTRDASNLDYAFCDDSIVRIRSAVKYVRSSPARLQRFRACVEKMKLESRGLVCLDVETRWNSTYLMLESAIKFQDAFEMLEEQDSKYRSELLSLKGIPMEEDWDHAKYLLPFLRGFYTSTLRISGSLYVTSNCYFHEVFGIGAMITKKMSVRDEGLRKMASRMKEKYDKYWSNVSNMNMFLFIGPILDPRHKLGYVSFIVGQSYDEEKAKYLCNEIEKVLRALFDHYSLEVGAVNETSANDSQLSGEEIAVDVDDDPTTFLSNQYKRLLEETSSGTGVKTELDRYLGEQCEALDNKFDLLDWWKKNESRLPIMAAMARDILAIPASTVASESSFSTGGRVLDAFRSSLTPTLVEALICSQNWLRSKNISFDIEEKLEDLEKFEAELKDLPQLMSTITVDD